MDMKRILGLSLIGAGPGNIFGPGMSAGALESFAGGGRGDVKGGGARGSAGGTKTAAAAAPRGAATPSGGKSATEGKAAEGANGQEGRGRGAADDEKARFRFRPALDLDGMFCFDAAVAPH